jgi:Lipocalin-like domain
MKFIFICVMFCTFLQVKAQVLDSKINYDSLIVNKWKNESVKINNKLIELSEIQKSSRLVFKSNHTHENRSNDFVERGKWEIDKKNSTLIMSVDILPLEKPIIMKIITLTSSKFIFSLRNEEDGQDILFTLVPSKE